MTNVEAIEMLIHECPKSPRKSYGAMKKAAFLMAIDALSDKRKKDIENAVIDRVLEIIDWDISQTSNERESISKSARMSELRFLREKVETLKGGEG